MSSEALNWAKSVSVGGPAKKAVLLVLADYADHEWSCFPSQAKIAEQAEVGERTVRRILAEWEQTGLIRRAHRLAVDGRGRTSDRIYLQPATVAGWSGVDQPAKSADQPATDDRPTGQALAGEPLENHQSRTAAPAARSVDDDFAEWYAGYPRKTGRGAALRAYRAARRKVDAETLLRQRDAFVRLMAAQRVEKRYIKHPSSWLNGEFWSDEDLDAPPPSPFDGPEMRFG